MKKLTLALLALAANLAIAPCALADTFSYTISGSNFTANLLLQTTSVQSDPGPSGNVPAYLVTSVSGTFTDPSASFTFGASPVIPSEAGANADDLTDAHGYLFDNLIYPTLPNNEVLDWGGILIEPEAGFYLNIFGGYFGSTDGLTAPGNNYFYFADNNYYSNNPIPAGKLGQPIPQADANQEAPGDIAATPEPGSLLLLGTGLLGLVFVVFRKAAKPSSHRALNA